MAPAILEKADSIRSNTAPRPRIGLTEFARSKKWRSELAEHDTIEIVDRGETAGFLLSPDGMESLLGTIDSLEKEIERMQIDSIFEARRQSEKPLTGTDLAKKATDSFLSRKKAMERAVNGD